MNPLSRNPGFTPAHLHRLARMLSFSIKQGQILYSPVSDNKRGADQTVHINAQLSCGVTNLDFRKNLYRIIYFVLGHRGCAVSSKP